MRNPYTTAANFWQERDFGAKISATFDFLGVHWRPLGKCLLYFVLPATLLMGIGLGLMTNSIFDRLGGPRFSRSLGGPAEIAQPYGASPFGNFNFGGMGLGFLSGMLAFLLLTGTVYGYLRARLRLPAGQPVTPADVWAELKSRLGRTVVVLAVFIAIYFSLVFGAVALIGVVASSLNGTSVLGFPLAGTLAMYLAVVFSLYFPVIWLEDAGVVAAIGRCFYLIRGQWWATFGLLLVVGLIQSMLAFVFVIPQYVVLFGKMLHWPVVSSDALGLVAQCIYSVGLVITYTVPLLALAFQYYNLAEHKEGWGLRLLVDELGQSHAAPVAHSSHYRPDEEGEY